MTYKYAVLDATAVLHFSLDLVNKKDDFIFLIAESIVTEIKSKKAKFLLNILKENNRIMFLTPSLTAIKKVRKAAKSTGDLSSLSSQDLDVIALSIDFPDSTVISDDFAVQNVCSFLNIPIKTHFFKIKHQREYFWKCHACGERYEEYKEKCDECGNKLKKYYIVKKS